MNITGKLIILLCLLNLHGIEIYSQIKSTKNSDFSNVQLWLTDPLNKIIFQEQQHNTFASNTIEAQSITVDEKIKFQQMSGFGFTLTGGSAFVINRLNEEARKSLLKDLFDSAGKGIGISYLRISIGASDLSDHVYSYDDMPSGQTDPNLRSFNLDQEKKDMIPLLKEIIQINPEIKIMASPWSPPLWMKTNNNAIGGRLNGDYYDAYSDYFIKYIQGLAKMGIHIDAVTIQNEPLHPGNNPSMYMSATEQNNFIKNSLGPRFRKYRIRTKIIIYDHNLDRLDYPLSILDDYETNKYIDGVAFHLYAGDISSMSYVHKKFPRKNLYFTEQWINSNEADLSGNLIWHIKNLIIGASRNWSKNVLEWNLATDSRNGPHTEKPGCDICLGALTITKDNVFKNPSYYIIAHASKFVRPGAFRINSTWNEDLPNVAFVNTNGKKVLIVLNNTKQKQCFLINYHNKHLSTFLNAGAVGSYCWN